MLQIICVFIHICMQVATTSRLYAMQPDILVPYPVGHHYDVLRTHRYVRDCQKYIHGNRTHASVNPPKVEDIYESKYIKMTAALGDNFGHWTVVKNPLKMISVLEPKRPSGCKDKLTATVTDSAKQMNCRISINAGFFNPYVGKIDYGACYGNIISNSRIVQNNKGVQNANFGIRQDGTVVIGYLSEESILTTKNPFVQLVSGVGWILRDGKLYLNESLKAECADTQTTGTLDRFFQVQSARTLIGYDQNGYVHILQIDGKTNKAGVNLYEAAKYLQTLGVTNAINMDGGGSATYVYDTTVINYPSDQCIDASGHKVLCPRNVSTIICVHDDEQTKTKIQSSCRDDTVVIALSVVVTVLVLACLLLSYMFITERTRKTLLFRNQQSMVASD